MRFLLICLSLCFFASNAFSSDNNLTLDSLSGQQKIILYQYGTLKNHATLEQAENYWLKNKQFTERISISVRDSLAQQLLTNVELTFKIKKPSRFRFLDSLFTATGLILSIASLIAAYAVIMLIIRYWKIISAFFIRVFAPLFRILFAPRILTLELLAIACTFIWFGPLLSDVTLRTIIVHIGLFLLWSQLTELTALEFNFRRCIEKVFDNHSQWVPDRKAFLHICIPFVITALAMFVLTIRSKDQWYHYELVIAALIALYAIPLVYTVIRPLGHLVLPKTIEINKINHHILPYIATTVILSVVSLFIPGLHIAVPLTLGLIAAVCLLVISIKDISGDLISNYLYAQLLAIGFFIGCILAGALYSIHHLSLIGVSFLVLYAIIKYWELPGFWNWYWKDYKAWGLLGMAAFLWLIATAIKYSSAFFTF